MQRLVDDTIGQGEWYSCRKNAILDFAIAWEWSDVTLPASYVTGRDKPNYPMPAIYYTFTIDGDEKGPLCWLEEWQHITDEYTDPRIVKVWTT